ncbi:MAG TPA: hypothetical protein VGM69_17195 [Chloroflexota bacterium]|jgi:hypothetical protein
MAFALNTQVYPAPGRNQEVRGLLEEWVRGSQAQGSAIGLSERVLPFDGVVYSTRTVFPDLAALERSRDRMAGDERYLALVARMSSITRRPATRILTQIIVPMAQAGPPGRYVSRTLGYPAAGREREMIGLVTEFVQRRQADGVARMLLATELYNPTGAVLIVARGMADLAELERNLAEIQGNPLIVETAAKVSAMSRQPITRDLIEILIQAPS